jgi:hypothetical protein
VTPSCAKNRSPSDRPPSSRATLVRAPCTPFAHAERDAKRLCRNILPRGRPGTLHAIPIDPRPMAIKDHPERGSVLSRRPDDRGVSLVFMHVPYCPIAARLFTQPPQALTTANTASPRPPAFSAVPGGEALAAAPKRGGRRTRRPDRSRAPALIASPARSRSDSSRCGVRSRPESPWSPLQARPRVRIWPSKPAPAK